VSRRRNFLSRLDSVLSAGDTPRPIFLVLCFAQRGLGGMVGGRHTKRHIARGCSTGKDRDFRRSSWIQRRTRTGCR